MLFLVFLLQSCNKPTEPPEPPQPPPPPPPPVVKPTLILELDDAHCTETWILLSTKDLLLPAELLLKQYNPNGDSISKKINLNTKDTLLYIDSLYPNQTYRYQVSGIWYPKVDSQQVVTSNELTTATMDTTSSSFTFEMFTFGGEIGSSVLYDVAIINENNIIAVGEIYSLDSTGAPDYKAYSIVKWDGVKWKLQKLFYAENLLVSPIRGINVVKPGEIYLAAGSIFRWDGLSNYAEMVFSRLSLSDPYATIEKLWSSNSFQLYGVGNRGTILHYNGASWSKLASGTTLNINDIWGDYNPKTNEWEILAVASNILSSYEKEVLKINNTKVELLDKTGIVWTLSSIWFKSSKKYYTVGSGIYEKYKINDPQWHYDSLKNITDYHINCVRANDINDIFIAGAYGEILHFNGLRWKNYQTEIGLFSGSYKASNFKNNLLVCVGYESTKAKILIGRRY